MPCGGQDLQPVHDVSALFAQYTCCVLTAERQQVFGAEGNDHGRRVTDRGAVDAPVPVHTEGLGWGVTFSVVVPVFGVVDSLPVALESVLTQSLADFEVIAVDDCSPDDCGRILDSYAAPAGGSSPAPCGERRDPSRPPDPDPSKESQSLRRQPALPQARGRSRATRSTSTTHDHRPARSQSAAQASASPDPDLKPSHKEVRLLTSRKPGSDQGKRRTRHASGFPHISPDTSPHISPDTPPGTSPTSARTVGITRGHTLTAHHGP